MQDDGSLRSWAWRVDTVFQMHQPFIYRSAHNRSDPDHWKWLQKNEKIPVYMLDVDPDVPASIKYPLEDISYTLLHDFYQGRGTDIKHRQYFTSSIAYALALAIYKGYETILVYGIEMSSNTEYIYQRDCVAFWVGIALGRGIEVKFHGGDAIFDRPLYGYDGVIEQKPEAYKERIVELEAMVKDQRAKKNQAEMDLHDSWESNMLSDNIAALQDATHVMGVYEGALHEARRYLYKIEDMWVKDQIGFIDRNEFEGSAGEAKNKLEDLFNDIHRTAGRIDYLMNVWTQTKNPVSLTQLKQFVDHHLQVSYDAGFQKGRWEENYRLAQEWDNIIKAAGGQKAVEMMKLETANHVESASMEE